MGDVCRHHFVMQAGWNVVQFPPSRLSGIFRVFFLCVWRRRHLSPDICAVDVALREDALALGALFCVELLLKRCHERD